MSRTTLKRIIAGTFLGGILLAGASTAAVSATSAAGHNPYVYVHSMSAKPYVYVHS